MKIPILFAALILSATAVFAQTPTDTQWWNDLQLTAPLLTGKDKHDKKIDKIVLTLDGIVRFGRDVSYPVDRRFSATVDFRVNKYLKISPAYLYQRYEQLKNQRTYESRLSIAANLEKKFDLFTFRHRSMFEYKFRNFRPNTEVYRSRFQLSYSLVRHKKELFAPFVTAEPYYDFKLHALNRKEFFAGISRKLSPRVALDVYYIRLEGKPVDANALGTNLKIRLW